MGILEGRVAVITGGASGIGAATCRRFAAEGAKVAVLDRDTAGAAAVAAEVDGLAVACDVADAASVDAAVATVADTFGTITDLVANAGMGRNKPLHRYTDAEWALVLGVNLTGTFHCIRAVVPRLLEAGGGAIVTVASLNSLKPIPGEAPYSAAKAGVANLTMTAAVEYGPTIRANCVSPGLIDTPLTALVTSTEAWRAAAEAGTPLKAIGTADQVASVIAFLCSDGAAYITGQNIVVDGGSGLPNLQADGIVRAVMGT